MTLLPPSHIFRLTMRLCCWIFCVCAAATTASQQAETGKASTNDGVYSAAQADRGARLYHDRCAACHHPTQFTGPAFILSWKGQTADALFDVIRNTMPTGNPASLKRQEYADILAYIFQANGLPAGATDLKGTDAALKRVVIEPPRRQSPPKGR
ncbi:MAG: cytochrome c [Acidobacteria bacterium]|nr:cytochrome c [Acidobacteriota bacterium]